MKFDINLDERRVMEKFSIFGGISRDDDFGIDHEITENVPETHMDPVFSDIGDIGPDFGEAPLELPKIDTSGC